MINKRVKKIKDRILNCIKIIRININNNNNNNNNI